MAQKKLKNPNTAKDWGKKSIILFIFNYLRP